VAEEVAVWHATAQLVDGTKPLNNWGFVKFYQKLEHHNWNPPMSRLLHKALRSADASGEGLDFYKTYTDSVEETVPSTIRDMLEIVSDRKPISIDLVEPVEAIMKRFCTGGMSLGALSREAHETLAIGVNRAGGRSNSGEGGEDECRWSSIEDATAEGTSDSFPHLKGLRNGDIAVSKIKQVASGRFGVTPEFPEGTYHYVLTEQYPLIPRQFAGTPDASFERRGPPGGGFGFAAAPPAAAVAPPPSVMVIS
jgi:glutamate synthase (ferredoxin)